LVAFTATTAQTARLGTTASFINAARSVSPDGVPTFEKHFDRIYDAHILLRSWLTLRDRTGLFVPGDVEGIIEYVYGENIACPDDASEALRAWWSETAKKRLREHGKHERMAMQRAIPTADEPDYFEAYNQELPDDAPETSLALQGLTRLSDVNVSAVLLYPDEARQLMGRKPGKETAHALLMRSAPITNAYVASLLIADDGSQQWKDSSLLRHHRYIPSTSTVNTGTRTANLRCTTAQWVWRSTSNEGVGMSSFNLVEKPWIPCIPLDGTRRLYSLRETLCDAAILREIADDSPLVNVALTRFLLAILHRCFGPRPSMDGALWMKREWDQAILDAYLDKHTARFDLFDVQRPFYQSPRMDDVKEYHPITRLQFERTSGNNPYSSITAPMRTRPPFPDVAARHLIAYHAFAVAGGVSQPFNLSDGLLTKGYTVLAIGENLFETLCLNLLPLTLNTPIVGTKADRPAWEQDEPETPEKEGNDPWVTPIT
jgi:hypothetical protein